jgi:hypothetical protein
VVLREQNPVAPHLAARPATSALCVAAIYQPDVSKWDKGAPKTLLSNWTLQHRHAVQFGSALCRPLEPHLHRLELYSHHALHINESTGNTATGINGAGPSPVVGLNSFNGPWIQEVDLGIARTFHLTERHSSVLRAQAFNLFNHPNLFVQNGSGVLANQFTPHGLNCGDGATSNQARYLLPNPAFGTLTSISELNGPRIFQFSFQYKF